MEIAAALRISERTVKFHGTNLLRKIGADSRVAILSLIVAPEGSGNTQPTPKLRTGASKKHPLRLGRTLPRSPSK